MAQKIYLDNAATTPLAKEVLAEMMPFLTEDFGNPSSVHAFGRKAKAAIEKARKTVADYLHAHPSEIIFTGCGTESSNTVIKSAVRDLSVQRIITSRAEHHCVLHPVEHMQREGICVEWVQLDKQGRPDWAHLEKLLQQSKEKTLVSLMHANNEIGTLLDLHRATQLCEKYGALFHSDTVQTIGYYPFDVRQLPIHFLTGSAHKFHGPKGVGFLYVNNRLSLHPFLEGGGQERNRRAGTENVYGIVGLGKALALSVEAMEEHRAYIYSLKQHMLRKLQEQIPEVSFNGDITEEGSNYKVLNVSLPASDKSDMLIFSLDMAGIAASGGSACSSGSEKASHVLEAIGADAQRKAIRFSFSRYNTFQEIDQAVEVLCRSLADARATAV